MNAVPNTHSPDLFDTFIIIFTAAAVDIFILWATYRVIGTNVFENLAPWMEQGYGALKASGASFGGAIAAAFIKRLTQGKRTNHPNWLVLIGTTALVILFLIVFLPRVLKNPVIDKYVETSLVSGGFKPNFMGGLPQLPGTQCGQTLIQVPDSPVLATVNEWKEVNWDASYICRRQAISGPVNGTVSWGTQDGKVDLLPGAAPAYGEWGIMKFKYTQPGTYLVSIDMATNCLDVGMPPNPCRAHGEFKVTVSK